MAEINITLNLEDKAAQQALRTLTTNSNKFGNVASKSFKKASTSFETFKGVFAAELVIKGLEGIARGFLAVGGAAVDLGTSFVDSASKIEDIENQFITLTQSTEKAASLIKDLSTFTATTPFQFEGVAQATKQLIAFQIPINEILPTLRNLGDVAAGSGNQLQDVAQIFGQVRAQSKLTGERLNQLEERAIPIGPAIAKTMGVAESAVRDLVSKGKVNFTIFEEAFQSLSKEGGLFFGATIRQSKTLSGVISTLKDAFELAGADIGKEFLPVLKSAAIAVTELVNNNKELIAEFAKISGEQLAQGFIILVESIPSVIQGLGRVLDTTDSVRLAFNDMAIGVAKSLLLVNSGIEQLEKGLAAIGVSSKQDVKLIQDQNNALTEFIINSKVSNAETERSRAERQKSFAEATKIAQEFSTQTLASFKKEQEASKKTTETKKKEDKEKIESEKGKITTIQALQEGFRLAEEEQRLADTEAAMIRQEEAFELIRANFSEEEAIRTANAARKLASEGKNEKAIELIRKKSNEAQKKSLSSLFDFEKNTNAGRAANFRSTLGTISSLSQENNSTLFAIGKAAALSTATIDGIQAVQKALAAAPPPFNFALAALVGVATAANIARISAQKPPPKRQEGGFVPGPNAQVDNQTIQAASGELLINRRQQTDLFNAIQTGQLGGGGQTTINIEGNIIADDENQVNRLMDRINDQLESRNATLAV